MTRRHPQSAEMQRITIDGVEFAPGSLVRIAGSIWSVSVGQWAKYGHGIPPGEPVRLTEGQIKEWRKR